jgi:hypothetical protein
MGLNVIMGNLPIYSVPLGRQENRASNQCGTTVEYKYFKQYRTVNSTIQLYIQTVNGILGKWPTQIQTSVPYETQYNWEINY